MEKTNKRIVMCTSTGCIEYAPERYHNLGIDIIRVHLSFKGKEYLDGYDLDPVDLYKQMENTKEVKDNLPHTAIPPYEEVAAHFQKAVDEGYEEAIVYCLSSYLGGTWNFIRLVADDFQDKIKIHVVDTRICCFTEGMMAIKTREWIDQGMPTEQILKEIEWIKKRQELIGLDAKLDYLIYNGRLKGGKAYMGKLMNICPVIHFNRQGEIVPIANTMGVRKAIDKACETLKSIIGDRDPKDYILSHVYTGTSVLEKMKVIEQKHGIVCNHEDVIMSPVAGIHNGPWLAGYCLTFIRREDEPLED